MTAIADGLALDRLTEYHTLHSTTLHGDPDIVYGLVADVTRWPAIFPPTVHVERKGNDRHEVLQMWALAHGAVRSWQSERTLDSLARTVDFRQTRSAHPVASMSGRWEIQPEADGTVTVLLHHWYRAVDDDAEAVELIDSACERNSVSELASLTAAVAGEMSEDDLVLDFTDELSIAASPEAVYEFLDRAERWPETLPHVARVDLEEPADGVQLLAMDTQAADGSTHTTESIRVCLDGNRIAYKQVKTPEVMSAHIGLWTIRGDGAGGAVAASRHVVVIRPEKVTELLGPDATIAQAREMIRSSLGGNSRATLAHASRFPVGVTG
jgi:aromatase